MMTIRHERVVYPPRGVLGGGDGSKGIDLVNNKKIPAKTSYPLRFGDIATFQTPGGGGMFSPSHRDKNKILEDVESELLSLKKAELIYKNKVLRKK